MKDIFTNNWEVIIAISALFISVFGAIITYLTFKNQRIHNIKMIKPILQIGQWDYENKTYIELRNDGLGPAMVDKIKVNKKKKSKTCIYHWLPEKLPGEMNYKNYLTGHENFVIKANDSIALIEIPIDPDNKEQIKYREKIRKIISELEIRIVYSDLYGNKMKTLDKEFWVFKRKDHVN
jgi:hypothetical protein